MLSLAGVFGFLAHLGLIYLGGRMTKTESATFWPCTIIAVLSYLLMAVFWLATLPFNLIPVLGTLIATAILFFGTAIATRMILNIEWNQAYGIGAVVAAANLLFSWIF